MVFFDSLPLAIENEILNFVCDHDIILFFLVAKRFYDKRPSVFPHKALNSLARCHKKVTAYIEAYSKLSSVCDNSNFDIYVQLSRGRSLISIRGATQLKESICKLLEFLFRISLNYEIPHRYTFSDIDIDHAINSRPTVPATRWYNSTPLPNCENKLFDCNVNNKHPFQEAPRQARVVRGGTRLPQPI